MACLDDAGLAEIDALMDYYLENAKILKEVRRTGGAGGGGMLYLTELFIARSRGILAPPSEKWCCARQRRRLVSRSRVFVPCLLAYSGV